MSYNFCKILAISLLLVLTQNGSLFSAEAKAMTCTFLSPLSFNGTQWKVRCINAPVYLARWENNAWRVLAIFDGTDGKYYLDWECPSAGVYAACDPFGRISDSVKIRAN